MPIADTIWGVKKNERGKEYMFRMDSLKDAAALAAHLDAYAETFNVNWVANFTTAQQFHRLNGMDSPYWSTNEGEVILTFGYEPRNWNQAEKDYVWDRIHLLVNKVAQRYGRWLAISGVPKEFDRANTVSFRLEMDSVLASDKLIRELDPHVGGAEYVVRRDGTREVRSFNAAFSCSSC
jgi:hypothetical protein